VKSLRPAVFIIAALAVLALPAAAWWASDRPVPAPEATFATVAGETVTTADLRGKVVLVNFWATSCVVCVKEMPRLVEAHRRHRSRGLETIAVAMSYDPPNYVARFVEQNALPFRVALDPVGEVAKRFGNVRLTPTTFVIDRHGQIVKKIVGAPDFAELDRLLDAALGAAS
jgi:peroxiredoxin